MRTPPKALSAQRGLPGLMGSATENQDETLTTPEAQKSKRFIRSGSKATYRATIRCSLGRFELG